MLLHAWAHAPSGWCASPMQHMRSGKTSELVGDTCVRIHILGAGKCHRVTAEKVETAASSPSKRDLHKYAHRSSFMHNDSQQ